MIANDCFETTEVSSSELKKERDRGGGGDWWRSGLNTLPLQQ